MEKKICQSCGMPIDSDDMLGTDKDGKIYSVVMTMNSTIFDLKEEIHYKYNKSIVEMSLYYHGKKLLNDKILQDCKFEEPDDIVLQTKPVVVKYNYC